MQSDMTDVENSLLELLRESVKKGYQIYAVVLNSILQCCPVIHNRESVTLDYTMSTYLSEARRFKIPFLVTHLSAVDSKLLDMQRNVIQSRILDLLRIFDLAMEQLLM